MHIISPYHKTAKKVNTPLSKAKPSTSSAFTIVELLIVIVVIAILAAITIISYGGISQRAKESATKTTVSSIARRLEVYKTTSSENQYPQMLSALGVGSSEAKSLGYTTGIAGSSPTFCLYGDAGSKRFIATNDNLSPREGNCAVTNLVANPNFALNTTGWSTNGYGTNGVATATRIESIGPTGGAAMRTLWSVIAVGAGHSSGMNAGSIAAPVGKTYTASVWVRANQLVPTAMIRVQYGSVPTSADGPAVTIQPNQWTRLSVTFTTKELATGFYVQGRINDLSGLSDGLTFDVTNYMLTEGDTLFNYADGDSSGWSWSGTRGASTSSGLAL